MLLNASMMSEFILALRISAISAGISLFEDDVLGEFVALGRWGIDVALLAGGVTTS